MKNNILNLLVAACCITACAGPTRPTLIELARQNSATRMPRIGPYTVTDRDVLDYADEVAKTLSKRFSGATDLRYSSSVGQTTLTALGAVAATAGWPVATASGLTAGSGFLGSLGGIFDEKSSAQAYESAYVSIQKAEATYYFYQLGGSFSKDSNGKVTAVVPKATKLENGRIPRDDVLTRDGEGLYYRVVSTLKLLDDALAKKIPDLQTVKDAQGDTSSAPAAPVPPASPSPAGAH